MKKITAKTPGKLILSGEHAVVYGAPAIACAINRFAVTTIVTQSKSEFFLDKLIQFTVNNFLKHFNLTATGLHIKIDSNISIGCGMGSSAAVVLSVIGALAAYFKIKLSQDEYFNLAQESEKLPHGNPSGIDACTCLHGGCIYFQKGHIKICKNNLAMLAINTGTPKSNTKECVTHVAEKFKSSKIWHEFSAITDKLFIALQNNNEISELIHANHKLLVEIGVVPQKVQNFINEIEKLNIAAKISGAGAVRGENAGIVLVFTDKVKVIADICARFAYRLRPIKIESRGLRIV
jgi:mevalonate kinase